MIAAGRDRPGDDFQTAEQGGWRVSSHDNRAVHPVTPQLDRCGRPCGGKAFGQSQHLRVIQGDHYIGGIEENAW